MPVVVDANVVFSALLRKGKPLLVFELNRSFREFEFITPEFLFTELGRRIDKLLKYTHFSREEFIRVFSFIKDGIEPPIPLETFEDRTKEAVEKSPHLKDVPYIALALKFGCKILSGDKRLKESLPDMVITPSEALEILYDRRTAS